MTIMPIIQHNPKGLFPQYQNHCHAVEVKGESRLLIMSGLNGFLEDGTTMPESFEEQCEVIWRHIGTILQSADMTYQNLIFMRFYLASRDYDEPNMRIRKKYLGDHEVSLTTIVSHLLDPKWKLEIEATAAA